MTRSYGDSSLISVSFNRLEYWGINCDLRQHSKPTVASLGLNVVGSSFKKGNLLAWPILSLGDRLENWEWQKSIGSTYTMGHFNELRDFWTFVLDLLYIVNILTFRNTFEKLSSGTSLQNPANSCLNKNCEWFIYKTNTTVMSISGLTASLTSLSSSSCWANLVSRSLMECCSVWSRVISSILSLLCEWQNKHEK